jgi:hypothetical protein
MIFNWDVHSINNLGIFIVHNYLAIIIHDKEVGAWRGRRPFHFRIDIEKTHRSDAHLKICNKIELVILLSP